MGSAELAGETIEQLAVNLMNEHSSSILRLCFLYLQDHHLAEDAMQETFLKACRSWNQFKGESSTGTWLSKIAVNVCRDYSRRNWFKLLRLSQSLDDVPEPIMPVQEFDDTLILSVMRLPRKLKEPILLYFYRGLSVQEIAQILSASVPTVYRWIKQAQNLLKVELEGWFYNE
ncbi:MAG TPA: sigma-70 family RNA polymerase sigma factor [Clostridiales bacterium]|jgi:RNA polymerase sigma-70 factor (ECF subfamily)|nr:sigma-70 family RNA polymerase sigma factor [Clostridiales bacterium]